MIIIVLKDNFVFRDLFLNLDIINTKLSSRIAKSNENV